jgi:DNA adenine methylase
MILKKLCDILKILRGKFILSINDHPKTCEIFREFKIAKVKTNYNAGAFEGCGSDQGNYLIIIT